MGPLEAAGGRAARQTARTSHPEGAQKGGQNRSIALDQTGYGVIRWVHWGPLNRTFPAPYPLGSALSLETPCFRPYTRVPHSSQKKVPKWRQTRTSDKHRRGECPRGPGNRGGHGPSRIGDGFHCAALNLCLRPVIEFCAGHFGQQRHTVKFCPFDPALFQS